MHANPKDPKPSKVRAAALLHNKKSESNGSLMRIAPLAVWMRKLENVKDVYNAVVKEQSLTHVRQTVYDATTSYCLAIRELINTLGDRKKAVGVARDWVFKNSKSDAVSWMKTITNPNLYKVFSFLET